MDSNVSQQLLEQMKQKLRMSLFRIYIERLTRNGSYIEVSISSSGLYSIINNSVCNSIFIIFNQSFTFIFLCLIKIVGNISLLIS